MLLIIKKKGSKDSIVIRNIDECNILDKGIKMFFWFRGTSKRGTGFTWKFLKRRCEFIGVVHNFGKLKVFHAPEDFVQMNARVPLA